MLNWIFQKMGKTLEHRQMSSPGNPSGEGFQADPGHALVAVSVAGQDLPPVLIDVRTEGEFAAGHLRGAHLLPLDRFTEGIEGPWCPTSSSRWWCIAALARAQVPQ